MEHDDFIKKTTNLKWERKKSGKTLPYNYDGAFCKILCLFSRRTTSV